MVLHQRKQKDERSYRMKFFLLALKNNRPVFIRYNTFSQIINIQEWTKKIVEDSLYKIRRDMVCLQQTIPLQIF